MMKWTKYYSVCELPEKCWDRVSPDNICLSSKFMEVSESTNPQSKYIYYVGSMDDKIIAIGFAYIKTFNLIPLLSKWINSGPSVLMTGTYETYGRHYWYDKKYFNEQTFIYELYRIIQKEKTNIIIFRDYVQNNLDITDYTFFKNNNFCWIKKYAVSYINLSGDITSLDLFLKGIKKKHRNFYRKILRERELNSVHINHVYDYMEIVEYLYPLYLNVNNKAKEYHTQPFPIVFFENLKKLLVNNVLVITMNVKNKIIGFVLLIVGKNEVIPFLMGMDYNYRSCYIWQNLTIESVRYAINQKKGRIDLGLTNYEIKKRLGAVKYDINMFARFKNPFLNLLFNKYLSKLI
jgi:predicted N-acyltransferase